VPGSRWWLLSYGPGVAQPDPDHIVLCIHHPISNTDLPAAAWGPGNSHGSGPGSYPGWLAGQWGPPGAVKTPSQPRTGQPQPSTRTPQA